jgi:hypothetical protein
MRGCGENDDLVSGVLISSEPTDYDYGYGYGYGGIDKDAAHTHEKHLKDISDLEIRHASAWLSRTGWNRLLQSKDRAKMVEMVAKPDAEEEDGMLLLLWQEMMRMFEICEQMLIWKTGYAIRKAVTEVNSKEDPHQFLKPYLLGKSRERHSVHWLKVVMYLSRSQLHPKHKDLPKDSMTPEQKRCWQDLWHLLRTEKEGRDEVGEEEEINQEDTTQEDTTQEDTTQEDNNQDDNNQDDNNQDDNNQEETAQEDIDQEDADEMGEDD